MKRCSAHATGMTFESASLEDEAEAVDDIATETGIDDEMKQNDQEHTDSENGNDGKEDGDEAQDSEKGNEGNDYGGAGGGSNAGWSDGWAEEEMSMESILEKARKMVAEMSNPAAAASAKPTKENKEAIEDDLTRIDDQNGKKKKVVVMTFVYPVTNSFHFELTSRTEIREFIYLFKKKLYADMMFVMLQSKKEEERIKREEIYAESQRLLRGNDPFV